MKTSVVNRLVLSASRVSCLATLSLLLAGCAGYRWTSSVPEELRTVAVPVFENRTSSAELGPTVSRYVLREFQREGTFKIAESGDAALEVQGVVKSASVGMQYFKRETSMRAFEHRYLLHADVSLVDRRSGKVLVNNRRYVADTTFFADSDIVTARRDASARLAEDLARQVVDDVVGRRWDKDIETKEKGK